MRFSAKAASRGGWLLGRLITTVFLLAFMVGGLFLTHQFWNDLEPRLRSLNWAEIECTIEQASVVDSGPEADPDHRHRFEVRYRYRAFNESFVGETYKLGYQGSDDIGATANLRDEYPVGSQQTCWFDPNQPSASVLRKARWSTLLFLGFPLLFVLAPLVVLFFLWRLPSRITSRHEGTAVSPSPTESITQSTPTKFSPGCIVGFFAVFALFGLGFLIPFFIVPAIKVVTAKSWTETSCRILESGIRRHAGDDGDTFSIEVLYSYDFEGREYRSSRYQFIGGSSSGTKRKQRVVDSLVPGTEVPCYVDPGAPDQAVINRGFTLTFLFALIPLVFAIIGLGGMYFSYRVWKFSGAEATGRSWLPKRSPPSTPESFESTSGGWSSEGSSRWQRSGFDSAPGFAQDQPFEQADRYRSVEGQITLDEPLGAKGKFFGMLILALFWNGIVSVFVWRFTKEWQETATVDGCFVLFLIPFVLVGLALLAAVPYQFLAMANPVPSLTLSRGAIPVGESARLAWRFTGAVHRLRRLEIKLVGEETAVYRRGTNTYTSRSKFAEISLLDPSRGGQIGQGSVEIEIPRDTMHSFDGGRNKIEWSLRFRGWIRRWPDVINRYAITVLPPEIDDR